MPPCYTSQHSFSQKSKSLSTLWFHFCLHWKTTKKVIYCFSQMILQLWLHFVICTLWNWSESGLTTWDGCCVIQEVLVQRPQRAGSTELVTPKTCLRQQLINIFHSGRSSSEYNNGFCHSLTAQNPKRTVVCLNASIHCDVKWGKKVKVKDYGILVTGRILCDSRFLSHYKST